MLKNFIKVRKTKKNFKGYDKKLTSKDLSRLKGMYIPPAYKTVYLHKNPNNKVQLIAEDNKGRNQYFYNPEYISQGEKRKYRALKSLVSIMDKISTDNKSHINRINSNLTTGINENDYIHIIINILLNNNFRIGNLKYDKLYNSSGITTLRRNHLYPQKNGNLKIQFIGKKGVENIDEITCPKMRKILSTIKQQSTKLNNNNEHYLFIKQNGSLIKSDDITNYFKHKYNAKITPKMFRTYNANYYMLDFIQNKMNLTDYNNLSTENKKKAYVKKQIGEYVSSRLHNTPSVCRSKYINNTLMNKIINNPNYYSKLGDGQNIHLQLKKFIG